MMKEASNDSRGPFKLAVNMQETEISSVWTGARANLISTASCSSYIR